jgi:DNA-binding response OmpR family regulator
MQLEIQTSKKSFVRHYLELLNGILKLTPRELDALLHFLEYDQEVACSMQARKHVAEVMSFKSVSVLNNYVKSLKDKQVIYKDRSGVYRYNDIVKPDGTLESLTFKFIVAETAVQAGV